jgi:NAD(P)-dependent dehydrogenase (short-subunit alcohol dehydrogenase family)
VLGGPIAPPIDHRRCQPRDIDGLPGRPWPASRASELHYSAAKAGLLQLTKTAALEYGQSGVRVNAICPSVIDTPTFRATMAGMPDGVLDGVLGRQGIRRIARAEEVAAAAVFLASDDASYLTGAVLPADGGYLAG